MRVISRRAIREYSEIHPDALPSLSNWFSITRKAAWKTLADLREDFRSADVVGRRTVFNIRGNKYRLIARVNYTTQRVFVLHIMTHEEHNEGDWK